MYHLKNLDLSDNNLDKSRVKELKDFKNHQKEKGNPFRLKIDSQGRDWIIKLLRNIGRSIENGAAPNAAEYALLCKAAVKDHGYTLKYIHPENLTDDDRLEIYLRAVQKDDRAMKYINTSLLAGDRYFQVCLAAVEHDGKSLGYINDSVLSNEQYIKICIAGTKSKDNIPWAFLKDVRHERLDREDYLEICRAAIERNAVTFREVIDPTPELCRFAVGKDGRNLEHVPKHLKDREICLAALEHSVPFCSQDKTWECIPEHLKDEEMERARASRKDSSLFSEDIPF
jgi:hypothetical protein